MSTTSIIAIPSSYLLFFVAIIFVLVSSSGGLPRVGTTHSLTQAGSREGEAMMFYHEQGGREALLQKKKEVSSKITYRWE